MSRDKEKALLSLLHMYVWNWQHEEGCIPLSDVGCICGLEAVKLLILDNVEE